MPHSPTRRLALIGTLFVMSLGCQRAPEPEATQINDAAQNDAEPPQTGAAIDLPRPAFDREALLESFLRASTAATLGEDDAAVQSELKGQRFEIRMRFGCPGGKAIDGRSWSYDEKAGSLKVEIKPEIDELVVVPAAADVPDAKPTQDHVGGFVIPAPAQLSAGCPVEPFAAMAASTNLRFGVVQRSGADTPRAQQLLPAYDIVKKIAPEAVPKQGLDLVLRGRMADGAARIIDCRAEGGVTQCLANVRFDGISIEDPANARLIAEWGAN